MPEDQTPTATLKIMISSTMLDLPKHRDLALDAIHRTQCSPVMMEHDTAQSGSDAITYSLQKVEEADIYVGIIGRRYGYIPDDPERNPDRLSITELEYRHAKNIKKSVLIFLPDKTHVFSGEQLDEDPEPIIKRKKLVDELQPKEIIGFFNNPDRLSTLLFQALLKEKNKLLSSPPTPSSFSRTKYTILSPPQLWAVPPYTLTNKFIGRSPELTKLDNWAESEDSVMVVVGIGGLGKSALTWEWANNHASKSIKNLHGSLWWSFYEQTSLEEFTRYALAYLTQQDPNKIGQDYKQNARQLHIELNARPSLLVLDGLERVLTAYHRWDKAQQRDDQVATDLRTCTNPADADLLRLLTHTGPSKILISSRLFPHCLEDVTDQKPIPGVFSHNLDGLSETDALAFIQQSGVYGDKYELLRFADRFGRHSLVLKIVCGLINNGFRRKPGDFNAWLADPKHGGSLKLENLNLKQAKTHILEFALFGLEEKMGKLLQYIAVLSEDIDYDTIQVLNPFVPHEVIEPIHIKNSIRWNYLWDEDHKQQVLSHYEIKFKEALSDYKTYNEELNYAAEKFDSALEELEERDLLQWDRGTNRYNMHPVVRGYASEQINEDDKKQAFKTARNHFGEMPEDDLENATELEHLSKSINIYCCHLGEGQFDDAITHYREKLYNTLCNRMSAFAVVAEQLEPLLDEHIKVLPKITQPSAQNWLFTVLANIYNQLDRNDLAMDMASNALKICTQEKLWLDVSWNLATLANIYNSKYCYPETSNVIQLRKELSQAIGDENDLANVELFQGGNLIRRGRFEEGELLLRESTIESPSRSYWLWHCQFLKGEASYDEWLTGLNYAKEKNDIKTQCYFLTQRALWLLELNQPIEALNVIDDSIHLANKMGKPDSLSHSIRAWALACLNRQSDAKRELQLLDTNSQGYSASQAWFALGEHDRSIEVALEAYRKAWGAGPPYSEWFAVNRIQIFLEKMNQEVPELPPFSPSKLIPIPHEKEIREEIKLMNTTAKTR